MPPKKAAAAAPATTKQAHALKAAAKSTSKPAVRKPATTKKTTIKKAVAVITESSDSPEPVEPKPTTKHKRKAQDEAEQPVANGTKRRKASDESDDAHSVTKRTTQPAQPTVVVKRPKATKSKVILNRAPTQRLDIYVFGEGAQGELGLGSEKGQTEVKRPRLNPHLAASTVGVVQLAVGGMHTAALTHDNKILTWGVNDQGALGRDTTWEGGLRDMDEDKSDGDSDSDSEIAVNPHESTPGEVDMSAFPKGTVITQLAASDSATFALTDEGFVYGWGTFRGNDGILGFSPESMIQYPPIQIRNLKKITKLACGADHVLALASNGAVFSWGSGQQMQLGRRVLERFKLNALVPQEFGLPKAMVGIGAGAQHCFAIHKNGKVYAWGLNNFGGTGISTNVGENEAFILQPKVVEGLRDKGNVTTISGGLHHSIAVTDKGECIVWGRLDGFQLGIRIDTIPAFNLVRDEHERPRILTVPTKVPGFEAADVAAGTDHCIAISKDGKAYSWGFSATYQTGQGSDEDIEVAKLIDNTAVRGKKLVWAGAGGQFSVIAGIPENGGAPMVNGVH